MATSLVTAQRLVATVVVVVVDTEDNRVVMVVDLVDVEAVVLAVKVDRPATLAVATVTCLVCFPPPVIFPC